MGAGHGFARAEVIEAFQEQAYEYDFAGKNVSIFYSTPGPNGGALLSYRWGLKKPLLFGGDEIRVVRTEIAQLVTVTLRQIPDLKTKTFTLLIPSINLRALMGEIPPCSKRLPSSQAITLPLPDRTWSKDRFKLTLH